MKDKYRLNIPRLHVLSRDQLELIHQSTLEVLRRTGVAVKEPEAVEIFKKAGFRVYSGTTPENWGPDGYCSS